MTVWTLKFNLFSGIAFFVNFRQATSGQVAIIKDPDGWTNVRKSPDGKSEILHRVYENQVFWYDFEKADEEKDWISIYFPKDDYTIGKGVPIVGFIHRSRFLPLENIPEYSGKNFSFEYKLSDFDSTNRVIDRKDGKWITAIDGRYVWGTDGEVPKTQVDDIKVTIDGHEVKIPNVYFSDIYECRNKFTVYKNDKTYFVYQWNSDGAGAYEVVWVFDENGLKQRLVGVMY
ncbi:hypothetical protein [Persicobacter psychrovividus]|uniref:SH3b domain-containing protein n=1 Tax=Persicobacter psychrovividus TaxID=387638 RepID=A0ABN6LBJ7_9BACT|nr:hypothetical protein PEPS_28810 [Persicobacter psychrovividus]